MAVRLYIGYISRDVALGNYYLDFSELAMFTEKGGFGPFDEQGIPLVDYDRLFRRRAIPGDTRRYGLHFTPVTVAQYALGNLSRYYSTQNIELRRCFLCQADWLLRNLETTRQGFGVWFHRFEFPPYRLKPPWVSAMAQGESISVLLRAYQLTDDAAYYDAARHAFETFKCPLEMGGVSVSDDRSNLWLEEFPSHPPSHVLNGFVFALFGVFDLYRASGDQAVLALWNDGIKTLRRNLHRYDLGYWSSYDLLRRTPADPSYHELHILQLIVLEELTGDKLFGEYARRWRAYAKSWIARLRRMVVSRADSALRYLHFRDAPRVVGVTTQPDL